jgi:hypothetical protein
MCSIGYIIMWVGLKKISIFIALSFSTVSLYANIQNKKCFNPYMIKLVKKAKKEINNRMYLTLATVDAKSFPWNTPVYSAFDQEYNFYWMSAISSQHSKNIRNNSRVFSVIYDSTVPEGTGFGVYLRGNAYELNSSDSNEIEHGIEVMAKRIHRSPLPSANNYLSPFPRRVYKFIPHQVWVNTIVNIQGKKIDQRVEITRCFL